MGTGLITVQPAVAAITAIPPRPHVVLTSPAAFDKLKPHWRGLADRAITQNPFMAPEFIEPAAALLAKRQELTLAAVYRRHARSEELIGLFALGQMIRRAFPLGSAPVPTFWSHRCLADATPLLSADTTDATDAVAALLDATEAPRRGGFIMPALAAGSAALSAISAAAAARGLDLRLSGETAHSHGLHIMLREPQIAAGVTVVREPAPLMAMLEQALAMDAAAPRAAGQAPADLMDHQMLAFLRATVRGFAHTRQAVMARLDAGGMRASLLAWLGADQAFIWRLFGPDARNPTAEAALAFAVGTATGRTPVAATADPVSGFCMAAHPTVTASLTPMV
jgi:hypothetical protein